MRTAWITIISLTLLGCQREAVKFDGEPKQLFSRPAERVALASTENGNLLVLAADPSAKRLVMQMSHDGGDSFMPAVFVSPEGAEIQYRSENGPSLLARGMSVYALWQQSRPEGGTDVVLAKQARMGAPFASPVRVTDKGPQDRSFNGFSSMALGPKGEIYVVWLDGRDQAPPQGTFSLYIAKSTDQGATFSKNVRIATAACPCCRPSVAVDDDGVVYVAWRKVFDGDIRDIVVASSQDGGATFSEPVKAADDHWVLHACPDSGPTLQAKNGRISIAWFSEGSGRSGIRYTSSTDNAKGFATAKIVSTGVDDPNHPVLATDANGTTLLAFQGRDPEQKNGWGSFATFAVKIDAAGAASKPQVITGSEGSSYPASISPGLSRFILAWTQGHEENASVKMVRTRL